MIILKKMSINEIIDIGPKLNISKKINLKNININKVGIISKKYLFFVKRFKSWFCILSYRAND